MQVETDVPSLVQILTQIQHLLQRPQCQPALSGKCVMLPQYHSVGSDPTAARNYWATFEKYAVFQTRQGRMNTFEQFKNRVVLTLIDVALNWFEMLMSNKQDTPTLKKCMKRFNSWGQTL